MAIDLFKAAQDLRVVDVFVPNETGWITPPVLYNRSVLAPDGQPKAPPVHALKAWILHKTMGSNTLRFWGQGLSAVPGNYSLASYLLPRDTTVYQDGQSRSTVNVVFKMCPDNRRCNHL